MSNIRKHSRLLAVAICCMAVGAGASAIAGAGAAPSKTAHPAAGKSAKTTRRAARRGLRGLALRAVHAEAVVHTKTGFGTVTIDRGKVDSVSGQQLTITEGTPKETYKTVTLTIPAAAKVRDDRQKATLATVKPGQRVIVVQAPKRTFVLAHNAR